MIWHTELQTKELPDNDSNQDDMEQQNYLMMISIRNRSKTYPFSGPRQIPIRKIPDNDTSYSPSDNNLPFLVSMPATTAKIEEKET